MKKILITGANGQIGSELIVELRKKYGRENVVGLDLREPGEGQKEAGPYIVQDALDKEAMSNIIKQGSFDTVFHMVGILSATGEKNPELAWNVNIGSLKIMFDLAREYGMKVFWASSIAAFGPNSQKDNTPQHGVMEPTTIYGVTKVAGELLGQYYSLKYGVDIRSLRYPGLISWKTPPGGGTTDYAVAIFYEAIRKGEYTCFVNENTVLPMMYMPDAIRGTIELMEAPKERIKERTSYNIAAISFSAKELEEEVRKLFPTFKCRYEPDERQKIADSWTRSIDDSNARRDWGWKHEYDLEALAKDMAVNLKKKLGGN